MSTVVLVVGVSIASNMTMVVGVIGIYTHALESVLVFGRMNHEHMSAKCLKSLLQASQCLFIITMASISCCAHRNNMASNFYRHQNLTLYMLH